MSDLGPLGGRVALVTGGGRGIGLAIVRKLASAGASVVVNDLDGEVVDAALAAIADESGQALAFVGDVTDPDFGIRFMAFAADQLGHVDIVVNNAGYSIYSHVVDMSDAQWARVFDVLLTAPFRLLRAVGRHFRDEPGPGWTRKVVNIASVGGISGSPGQAAYGAAKAGLINLTRTLAKEWGPYGVTVNAIAPGLIRTRLTEGPAGGHDSIDIAGERLPLIGTSFEDLIPLIPLRREGTPHDIGNAAYLLCLPESDYITGEVTVVSGGWMP